MFIKPSKFEKLIKTAYKGGRLHVGNDGENFLAAGAGWSMSMRKDLIPKELRAIIIKYVGRMPDVDEYFLALEDGDQTEVPGHSSEKRRHPACRSPKRHIWHMFAATTCSMSSRAYRMVMTSWCWLLWWMWWTNP